MEVSMKKLIVLISMLSLSALVWADDYGAAGALSKENFTLEEMLAYAIEDEYLALNEYQAIMEKLDVDRPYSNIAESEKTHIAYLEELYKNYKLEIPEIDALNHLYIPASLSEAAEIGVQAEINNIAMYEKFLKQELPDDIRTVFENLLKGSENHLRAFQRQTSAASRKR
jgi:hypothetical protein